MEAMILAAGLGTRLRPLTNELPKALVPVGDRPMLEHVALRLIDAGCDHLVVNVHHHADQVVRFIEERDHFGIKVDVSVEPDKALETGGGLANAAHFFRKKEPFLMHNADIFTNIDLLALRDAHASYGDVLATLAVRAVETNRFLLFDDHQDLCGYGDSEGEEHVVVEPRGSTTRFDFCGVQIISPRIFDLMPETGVFSIINTYLSLSREGEHVRPHRVDGAFWIDVGNAERLEQARLLYEQHG